MHFLGWYLNYIPKAGSKCLYTTMQIRITQLTDATFIHMYSILRIESHQTSIICPVVKRTERNSVCCFVGTIGLCRG